MVPQIIVVRGSEANRHKGTAAPWGEIVAELRGELGGGAEVACLRCNAKFCGTKEIGAVVIQPNSREHGHLGAVCKRCALAATNDDLIGTFQAELMMSC